LNVEFSKTSLVINGHWVINSHSIVIENDAKLLTINDVKQMTVYCDCKL